ncbi:uncharacterized protein LOC111033940 [Myzus persicae]|uniref:uncharacterized protein LOC111033940 n=1 Tax=Myzus persicae TaxID=13164 RepID=UPI000B933757|nr:uncharacterized protein LOC111033940 [Myzus persicae]XP_022170593.1 uncharacterized protein LOC111033940 [Myzus persicae]
MMELKKGNGLSCAVKYCNNKSRTSVGVSYFTMPKNTERRSEWIKQCLPEYADKNAFVQNLRICSEHFEDKMFLNVQKKNRLTDFAVPTLFSDEILAKRESESDSTMNESNDLSTPMACSSPISCPS